jgi:hypothetical protein
VQAWQPIHLRLSMTNPNFMASGLGVHQFTSNKPANSNFYLHMIAQCTFNAYLKR